MRQKERGFATTHRKSPSNHSTSLIVVSIDGIEKTYLRELAGICEQTALTDSQEVFDAAVRIFESVPGQLRRMRQQRIQLPRTSTIGGMV